MTYSAHQPNTPPAEAAIEAVAADVAPELGVCAPEYCRYCGFLVLTPCDMPPADVCDDALSALYEERRRMSAAAAHAYEMQTGGTHD